MHFTGKTYQRGVSKLVVILLVLLIVILLAVGTAAALYLTGVVSPPGGNGDEQQQVAEQDEPEEEQRAASGPAQYMRLDDAITVNINREGGRSAILQARIELMARDEAVLEGVERHLPMIRNNLISLFGDQRYEEVTSSDGKNALREHALEEINDILREEGEQPNVEAVFFTHLVTQ